MYFETTYSSEHLSSDKSSIKYIPLPYELALGLTIQSDFHPSSLVMSSK